VLSSAPITFTLPSQPITTSVTTTTHSLPNLTSHYLHSAFPASHKNQTPFHAYSYYTKPIFQQTASYSILTIKPTRCTNFSNLFLEQNSTCFRQVFHPSSGNQFHPNPARKQSAKPVWHTPTAVHTALGSWWWTEDLSETRRVLFQEQIWEISASRWFFYKNVSWCSVLWISN